MSPWLDPGTDTQFTWRLYGYKLSGDREFTTYQTLTEMKIESKTKARVGILKFKFKLLPVTGADRTELRLPLSAQTANVKRYRKRTLMFEPL